MNVYGQSNDSGLLSAISKGVEFAAIGSDNHKSGNINFYGGSVHAEADWVVRGAGIGNGDCGSIFDTQNAGKVTIYGGTVNATGGNYGSGADLKIYGGIVTAQGGENGIAIGIGYCDPIDRGYLETGTLTLGDKMTFKAGHEVADTKMTPKEYYQVGYRYAHVTPCFEFVSKNLALESSFAFKFYGYLYDENPAEDAYMEFHIGNIRTVNVPLSDAIKEDKNRYVFTCYLNVLELNENIGAIFHDGEFSVERQNPLSVTDYLNQVYEIHKNLANEYDVQNINIINAISNYAHYAQLSLDETHNEYTVGADGKYLGTEARTAITLHTTDEFSAYKSVKTVGNGFTDVSATSRSLILDDATALVVYITPANSSYIPNVKVTDKFGENADFTCTKLENGKYKVVIHGIAAHMLGSGYTVDIDNGKLTYTNLSALSYVYSVLSGSGSEATKNAVSTLYDYYLAAIEFKEYTNGGH